MIGFKTAAAALVAGTMTLGAASSAYAYTLSPGCANFSGQIAGGVSSGSQSGTGFSKGEVLSLVVTQATGVNLGLLDFTLGSPVVSPGAVSFSYTVPADTTDNLQLLGTTTAASAVTWLCLAAANGTADSDAFSQLVFNSTVAFQNGRLSMQNYNTWSSMFAPPPPAKPPSDSAVRRPAPLTARTRLLRLEEEERDLVEQRAELVPGAAGAAELDRKLKDARRDVRFARVAADLASPTSSRPWRETPSSAPESKGTELAYSLQPRDRMKSESPAAPETNMVSEGPIGGAPARSSAPPAISLSSRDLVDYCGGPDVCDVLGKRWNVWMEGRVIGATDSLARTNALGFMGAVGAGYTFLPWLSAGLAVGVEGFETKLAMPGQRIGTTGLTAAPYVGFRFDENITATVFGGLTTITYNSNPATGVSAQFDSLRLFFGGGVSGTWRDGPWRFQPTLGGTFASEQMHGYTDSAGTVVPSQTLTYGRVSAGPEIGYTFWQSDQRWSVEPFVMAHANIDFTSTNLTGLNGQSLLLRPGTQGSGTAGVGFDLRFPIGFSLRAQASYESIGVAGLDVWQGVLRGSLSF
jgi:hypothetical protein